MCTPQHTLHTRHPATTHHCVVCRPPVGCAHHTAHTHRGCAHHSTHCTPDTPPPHTAPTCHLGRQRPLRDPRGKCRTPRIPAQVRASLGLIYLSLDFVGLPGPGFRGFRRRFVALLRAFPGILRFFARLFAGRAHLSPGPAAAAEGSPRKMQDS